MSLRSLWAAPQKGPVGGVAEATFQSCDYGTASHHKVTAALGYAARLRCPRRDAGEALTDIARTFAVSHTTIGRLGAAPAV